VDKQTGAQFANIQGFFMLAKADRQQAANGGTLAVISPKSNTNLPVIPARIIARKSGRCSDIP